MYASTPKAKSMFLLKARIIYNATTDLPTPEVVRPGKSCFSFAALFAKAFGSLPDRPAYRVVILISVLWTGRSIKQADEVITR
jgi:hypothetical protein